MATGIKIPTIGGGSIYVYSETATFTTGRRTQQGYYHYFYNFNTATKRVGFREGESIQVGAGEDVGYIDASGDPYQHVGTTSTFTYYSVTTVNSTGGTVSGGGNFDSGTNCTITATPNSGYVVTSIDGTAVASISTGNKTKTFSVTMDRSGVSATFAPYYKLSFDGNGNGSSNLPSTISPCLANTQYTIPDKTPTRTGYLFLGWATTQANANNGVVSYQPGDNYSRSSVTANQTVTLYAVWKQYTLTYDANGGSSTPASQSYYGNVTLASAITFTGRTFLGWKIGSTIYSAGATYNLKADAVAVAQWTNISIRNDNTSVGSISLFDVSLNTKVADEVGGYIKYSGVQNHVYRVDVNVSNFLYEARGVYVNGAYIEPYQFTFTGADVTGVYYFAEKPLYSFEVTTAHGTVAVSPAEDAAGGMYARGRAITLTITPDVGYSASQATLVNIDNNDVYPLSINNGVVVLDGIAFNSRVVIDYSQIDYELSASIDTPSASAISAVSVEVGGSAADSAHYGDVATFTATVAEGFLFAGWYDSDGNLQSANATYTPTVSGDINLTAKAMVAVSFAINYTGADGNETCVLTIDGEEYEETFGVILGESFAYALTLGNRTEEERWYLDVWKDGSGNTCLMPLSDTLTPTAAISYTAYVKPKSSTERILTINTGKFGESGNIGVTGTPYDVIGDYAPAHSGTQLLNTPPPGQFRFNFYGVQYVKLTAAETAQLEGDSADAPSVFRGFYDSDNNLLTAEPSAVLLLAASRTIWAYYGSTAPVTLNVAHADADGSTHGSVAVIGSSDPVATIAQNGLSASITQGYTATVTATPKNGYEFKGWYDSTFTGGTPLSTNPTWTFTLMYARTVYAKFVKNTHAVCEWEGDDTPKVMTWRSKTYESSKPFNPSACRVDALGYDGDSKGTFLDLTVDMFSAPDSAPTASATLTNIASQNARRLPVRRMERYMQIQVKANVEVDTLLVGTSMGGLAQ